NIVGAIVSPKTNTERHIAFSCQCEQVAPVFQFALDGEVYGLPDSHLACRQSHHIEITFGIGGAARAWFITAPRRPQRKPGKRQIESSRLPERGRGKVLVD